MSFSFESIVQKNKNKQKLTININTLDMLEETTCREIISFSVKVSNKSTILLISLCTKTAKADLFPEAYRKL